MENFLVQNILWVLKHFLVTTMPKSFECQHFQLHLPQKVSGRIELPRQDAWLSIKNSSTVRKFFTVFLFSLAKRCRTLEWRLFGKFWQLTRLYEQLLTHVDIENALMAWKTHLGHKGAV